MKTWILGLLLIFAGLMPGMASAAATPTTVPTYGIKPNGHLVSAGGLDVAPFICMDANGNTQPCLASGGVVIVQTNTYTLTSTPTISPTSSITPSITATSTASPTLTITLTATPTFTVTLTSTNTPSITLTPTKTMQTVNAETTPGSTSWTRIVTGLAGDAGDWGRLMISNNGNNPMTWIVKPTSANTPVMIQGQFLNVSTNAKTVYPTGWDVWVKCVATSDAVEYQWEYPVSPSTTAFMDLLDSFDELATEWSKKTVLGWGII